MLHTHTHTHTQSPAANNGGFHPHSCIKKGPPPGVFFHINNTNATQEDVIYANEYHEALEYEGPVLWPGDLAIWVRKLFLNHVVTPYTRTTRTRRLRACSCSCAVGGMPFQSTGQFSMPNL